MSEQQNQTPNQTINLVQYGRLLALRSSDIVQFLTAAKSVSAGYSDVPERALQMIANDPEIEAMVLKTFTEIEDAQNRLRALIAAFKVIGGK